jgi:histidine ammonia-lyase
MGMGAALKLRGISDCIRLILAIELLTAAQALEFRKPLKPGVGVNKAYEAVRKVSPRLHEDRPLSADIERLAELL